MIKLPVVDKDGKAIGQAHVDGLALPTSTVTLEEVLESSFVFGTSLEDFSIYKEEISGTGPNDELPPEQGAGS